MNLDPTPKIHRDPHGAEYAVACLYCGRVHRTKDELRDKSGNIVDKTLLAEVWQEGYEACGDVVEHNENHGTNPDPFPDNPYRESV